MNLKKNITMKHLTRSKTNRKILGICGGFAEYLDVDPTIVRLITFILGVYFPPTSLVYFLSSLVIPEE